MTRMGSGATTEPTLFGDTNVSPPDEDTRPELRARALGGVLAILRARNGWSVEAAAAHAGLSHMTVRRLEEGRPVRSKSLAAVDRLLERTVGTVHRALNDDDLMVDLVRAVAGVVDDEHVGPAAFLARFAEQTGPQHRAVRTDWPEVEDATRRALALASMHVPSVRPTDLEVVNRMIERLAPAASTTESIRDLVQAAARAIPDLIARQLDDAEHDLATDSTDSAAPLSAEHADMPRSA